MANSPVEITTRTAATAIADGDLFGLYKLSSGLWNKLTGAVLRDQLIGRTVSVSDLPSGGAIGTAAATVDVADVIVVNQTTASKLISLPTPTNTSLFRRFTVVAGSTAGLWTAYGRYVRPGGMCVICYIPGVGYVADNVNAQQMLYATATTVVFPTDTAENNVAFVTIPGGFMGTNSVVNISTIFENTSGISNKTVKIKFGAFNPYSASGMMTAATSSLCLDKPVIALNSTSAQITQAQLNYNGSAGASTTLAPPTGTANTAADVLIQCSVQKFTGGDTTTLRSARVTFSYGG